MLSGLFENASNGAKFIISIFVILIGLVTFWVIGILLAIPVFNLDISALPAYMDANNLTNIPFLKYFQAFTSIGIFIVPSFAIAYLLSKNPLDYLSFNKKNNAAVYFIVTGLVIFAIPLINWLAYWNAQMTFPESLSWLEQFMRRSEDNAEQLTKLFVQAENIQALLLNIFIIAVIPAIGEELLFRGIFQKLFTAWTDNKLLGIWLAAFLFSAIHIQFYGFIPRLMLGALFGYILIWTGNMYLPILAHFINNAFAVIAYYMMNRSVISTSPDELGTGETGLQHLVASIIPLTFLLYALYRLNQKNHMEISE